MHDWRLAVRRQLSGGRLDAAAEQEVVEELAQHLEDRYAELRARGVSAAEAESAVLEELHAEKGELRQLAAVRPRAPEGAVLGARENGPLGGFAGDVRYAFRSLRRSPGYTAVVVLTLALGIGAAATAQGVIDPLLLRPLAFDRPEQLVTLSTGLMPGEYEIVRAHTSSFEQTSLIRSGQAYAISVDGEAERVLGAAVTPELFSTLGVRPLLGTVPGAVASAGETAVLSFDFWQRRFGGDPGVIGRTLRIEGRPVVVSAVMPRGFSYPSRTELWLAAPLMTSNPQAIWGIGGFHLVARLRDGAAAAAAAAEVRGLSAEMSAANPFWTPSADYRAAVDVISLHEALLGEVRPALLLLAGAVTLLLLIACANVANLVLARGLGRTRELAVRTALGASSGRIVRHILTETLVLAIAGGGAGVALAFVSVHALRSVLPPDLPRVAEIGVDPRVLIASLVLSTATGLLLGILPALRATHVDVQASLRDGTRAVTDRSGRRLSGGLVIVQVALAVLLVTGAGLLARSLLILQRTDTGIARLDVVTARIDLPSGAFSRAAERRAFYDELRSRVGALAGARSVALSSQLPFSGHFQGTAMLVEHVTPDPNNLPVFLHRRVTPHFFEALGVPLLRGRLFTEADMATDGAPIAIVDEAAARAFWPGEDPVGRRLGRPWMNELLVVAGVVGSVLDGELAGTPEPTVYTPLPKEPPQNAFVIISSTTGLNIVPPLRAALREVNASVPLSDVGTVRTVVSSTLRARRLSAGLVSAFGFLALVLAAVGIYGVLAYAVGQRSRELSLRLALGARAGDVLRMVLREGMILAGTGAALGIAASFTTARLIRGMLHGVEPHDPTTLVGVTAVVLVAAAVAVLVPARRASRTDPMNALRE
jgi:putative ABC transport system permease protein